MSTLAGNLKAHTNLKAVGKFLEDNPDKVIGCIPLLWVTATAPRVLIDGRSRIQLPSRIAMMIGSVCLVFWLSKYTLYEYVFQAIGLRMIFSLKKNSNRLIVLGIMIIVWFYDTLFALKSP
jgi:hypothetical protein